MRHFLRNALSRTALAGLALTAGIAASSAARADSAAAVVGKMAPLADGASVYQHVCQGCHMADGHGARGAGAGFPAFAGDAKLSNTGYPIYMVLNGHGGMPWFTGMLSDKQVADVINYIRTHFGNDWKDSVKPEDVAAQHPVINMED